MEINEITRQYRIKNNLSYRQFADVINKSLINTDVSHSTVRRWEIENYEPNLSLLFECIATYPESWIARWAVENIQAMYPDLAQSGIIQFRLPNHKDTIQR
jgi:transcriptional regulator with XRE-family HTH domain